MSSNFQLSEQAYANIENAGLLPGEEIYRDRRGSGTGTQYDEVAAQAPVAADADAFPAFQRPQSMEEINIRKKQKEFMKLSVRSVSKKNYYTRRISREKCPFKLI